MNSYPEFDRLMEIMKTLRSPKGCPWDAEQTHESLIRYLREESFEVIEAIHAREDTHLCEELGDLILQVVFHAVVAEQRKAFTIREVLNAINKKLEHRHPHVFKQGHKLEGALDEQWEKLKKKEKEGKPSAGSCFESIPEAMEPWWVAERLQLLAAKEHFDWEGPEGILEKMEEEIHELREEFKTESRERQKEEMGDILFSMINLCRFLKMNPVELIRRSNDKFSSRYQKMKELALKEKPEIPFKKLPLEEKEAFWQKAKRVLGKDE